MSTLHWVLHQGLKLRLPLHTNIRKLNIRNIATYEYFACFLFWFFLSSHFSNISGFALKWYPPPFFSELRTYTKPTISYQKLRQYWCLFLRCGYFLSVFIPGDSDCCYLRSFCPFSALSHLPSLFWMTLEECHDFPNIVCLKVILFWFGLFHFDLDFLFSLRPRIFLQSPLWNKTSHLLPILPLNQRMRFQGQVFFFFLLVVFGDNDFPLSDPVLCIIGIPSFQSSWLPMSWAGYCVRITDLPPSSIKLSPQCKDWRK